MRINKYIAKCGVASRRKSEDLIKSNKVTVNGIIVSKLSTQIDENKDIVKIDGQKINLSKKNIYIALNKPEGYITTSKDQFNRPSVLDLINNIEERLYPVGRLDYETSGLLILTNDGDLTYKVTHPKQNINKTYRAMVKGIPNLEEIRLFENGLKIEDYITSKAKLNIIKINREKNYTICDITIHEGKNRQVRKMCKSIGHPVMNLKRIYIGKIGLNGLKVGKYRHLTDNEINYLKNI